MMRFHVITDPSGGGAIPFAEGDPEKGLTRLRELLAQAEQKGTEELLLQAPPSRGSLGADFSPLTNLERVIVDHLREHDAPDSVTLVFPDQEYAKTAKVVYNCWFAVTKEDRLLEDGWD